MELLVVAVNAECLGGRICIQRIQTHLASVHFGPIGHARGAR